MRRTPLMVALGLLAALAVLVVPGTLAGFTDGATATSAAAGFTSGTMAVPAAPTSNQTATASVTLTWTASAVGTTGGTATTYDILRYPSATGGTATVECAQVAGLTCVDDVSTPAASAWYAVRARVGDSWVKEGPRTAYVPDTTAPTLTIVSPLTTASAGCTAAFAACGTASDAGSGVAKVEYQLRRTRVGQITGTTTYWCWSGTAWGQVADANSCTWNTATGTTSWTVPGAKSDAYAAAFLYSHSFQLSVRATDRVGNVSGTSTATG